MMLLATGLSRRQLLHFLTVLLTAVAVRVVLEPHVAIRGDLGYWLLDGQWVAAGDRPFFDFIGRSPLFLYLSAIVFDIFGASIATFRWFVATMWLGAAVVVAAVTRLAASHRASLITFALTTLTPFPVAFAFFSSSQSVAVLLVAVALLLLVARQDWWVFGAAGAFVGAAFLSRRAMVLAGPAIASWLALEWRRGRLSIDIAARKATATTAGFFATLLVGYTWLAYPDVGAVPDLFIIHFVNLFVSTGSGGVPLLSMADAVVSGETATSSSTLPVMPLLDDRSQQAIMASVLGGVVLMLGLADYARAATGDWLRPLDRTMVYSMAGVLAPLAAVSAALAGLWYRLLWLVAVAALLAALHSRDALSTERLLSPGVALPTLLFAWIQLGYFVRPNLYATYYGMDTLLFLAVPVGIMADEWAGSLSARRSTIAVASVVVLVVTGAIPMAPLLPGLSTTADGQHDRVPYFTPDRVRALSADLEARAGGTTVLTSQPNYVAVNNVSVFEQNSRAVYLRHLFGDSGPQREYYGRLNDAMESGHVTYVVHDRFNQILIETNTTVNQTFRDCYSAVDANGLYRSLNTTLYRHNGCTA